MRSIILQDNKLVKTVAIATTFSLLLWTVGLQTARGASVDDFSDTLTDTDLLAEADHTIVFTTPTGVANTETITLTFQAGFDLTTLASPGDFDISGSTFGELTVAADCTGTDNASVGVSGQVVTFTLCAGDGASFAASEVVTIEIGLNATSATGTGANQIINPNLEGSYTIDLGGTMADSGQTRVYIIDDIQMTAVVNTTFEFAITGVASGQDGANGEGVGATTVATQTAGTDPEVDWGTLTAGSPEVARHDLTVTTNAQGGFSVTVWQDGNIRSANGSDIDQFRDGVDGAAQAWAAPSENIADEDTWGHMGITSEDSTLTGASDPFGATLYDAIPTGTGTPLEVFFHDGPADGSTADQGATRIGYKLEITALQEAADDYSNLVTYVATPVF